MLIKKNSSDGEPCGEVILNAEKLSMRYETGDVIVNALKNVSFQIRRGEFIVVLGPSGDSSTAVLLGALTMYGMVTGPTLLSKSSDFVCRLYIIMLLANIIILPLGLLSAKVCIKLLSVKNEYIQMAVLLICCIGAYSLNRDIHSQPALIIPLHLKVQSDKVMFPYVFNVCGPEIRTVFH